MLKHILTLVCIITLYQLPWSQTPESVLTKYYEAIGNLNNISYNTHNIDTFLTGTVWDNRGYCIMKRQKSDTLFGFLFKGKRNDIDEELIYYGSDYYLINEKSKSYKIEKEQIHRGMLGHPGGQMVLSEFVQRTVGYKQITLTQTDSTYVLRFDYPDNQEYQITNRYKEVHLNNKTYLPVYRYHTLTSLGAKQVNISYIYNLEINVSNFIDPFSSKEFLLAYSYEAPKDIHVNLNTLINKIAPDFELVDTNDQNHKLSALKGKTILLDFWEIWCGPCRQSIPKIKIIADKYSSDDLVILSIVSDKNTFNKIPAFKAKMELNYSVLFSDKVTSNKYMVNAVPLYILVDKEGIIRHTQYGWSDDIEKAIVKYL